MTRPAQQHQRHDENRPQQGVWHPCYRDAAQQDSGDELVCTDTSRHRSNRTAIPSALVPSEEMVTKIPSVAPILAVGAADPHGAPLA